MFQGHRGRRFVGEATAHPAAKSVQDVRSGIRTVLARPLCDDLEGKGDQVAEEHRRLVADAVPPPETSGDGHDTREQGLEQGSRKERVVGARFEQVGDEVSPPDGVELSTRFEKLDDIAQVVEMGR